MSGGPPESPDREDHEPAGGGTAVELGRYAGHGLTIALSTALFAWAGVWVDERLHTAPLFVTVGVFVGFGAAFYSMYRDVVQADATRSEDGETGHGPEDES